MFEPALAVMIGEYILERRRALGMTQKDLKSQLGFSAQFMGRIEKGKVMIPESSLVKLIALLKLEEKKLMAIFKKCAEVRCKKLLRQAQRARTGRRSSRH